MFRPTHASRGKFYRFNSTIANHIRPKTNFFQLLRTPIAKSLLLTFLFGSFVVDLMQSRKELDLLKATHRSKFQILSEIIDDLKSGKNIDVTAQLKLANSLTKHKYNTVLDVELDEQLEQFLKLTEEEVETVGNQLTSKNFL